MRGQLTEFERLMSIRRRTVDEVIHLLRQKYLLKREMKCEDCSSPMIERAKNDVIDKRCWVCRNAQCPSYKCTKNTRAGSFFEGFRASLTDVFTVILLWYFEKQVKEIITVSGFSCRYILCVKIFYIVLL